MDKVLKLVHFSKRLPMDEPKLSPDLDWMLLGVQASPSFILEKLVQDYYASLLRFSNAVLGNLSISEEIIQESFISIVAKRRQHLGYYCARLLVYAHVIEGCKIIKEEPSLRGNDSPAIRSTSHMTLPKQAVYGIPDGDIWQAIGELDKETQHLLILKYIGGLSSEDISNLMGLDSAHSINLLACASQHLSSVMDTPVDDSHALEVSLTEIYNRRWPVIEFTESELQDAIDTVQRKYRDRIRRSEKKRSALKYSLIGGCILFMVLIGWGNAFVQIDHIINTLFLQSTPATSIASLQTAPPSTTCPPSGCSQTSDSAVSALSERITHEHPYWDTVWLNALVYQHGPPGYVGSPVIRHEQMWVTRRGDSLLISGSLGEVDRVLLAVDGENYDTRIEPDGQAIYLPGSSLLEDTSNPYSINSRMIFETYAWAQEYKEVVIGDGKIAGRETLILDLFSEDGLLKYRLWVDVSTGLSLRILSYAEDGQTIVGETSVNNIFYDVELPPNVFDPNLPITHFVVDYRALQTAKIRNYPGYTPGIDGHDALPRIPPPVGFDPTKEDLRMQWFKLADAHSTGIESTQVGIFAGQYYLGKVVLDNPWSARCERSTDGKYVGVSGPSKQVWIDTTAKLVSHEALPPGSIYGDDLAFSPDSQFMAFWGCGVKESNCGVYLLDLKKNKLKKLLSTRYAHHFSWRPDGKELLMVNEKSEVMIVQLDPMKGVYRSRLDESGKLPQDLPANQWGVLIDPAQVGGSGCAYVDG